MGSICRNPAKVFRAMVIAEAWFLDTGKEILGNVRMQLTDGAAPMHEPFPSYQTRSLDLHIGSIESSL